MARQTKAQQIELAAQRLAVRSSAGLSGTFIQVHGIPELAHELKVLPGKISSRLLRSALFEAAEMMADTAYRMAPKDTGQLAESITARRRRINGIQMMEGADVYAKRSRQTPGGYYAHLVELGHAIFRTTRSGKYFVKYYPGSRFMTKTAQLEEKRAIETVRRRVEVGLERFYAGKRRL